MMNRVQSFAPVVPRRPRVLILGSMPGVKSLEKKQYYAHPHNVFWRIMEELFQIDSKANYQKRISGLKRARLALWDVFHFCQRRGSADTAIRKDSEVANNVAHLLRKHTGVRLVLLNGRKAGEGFRRHLAPQLKGIKRPLKIVVLPSTSPAHARMSFEEKCRHWRAALLETEASTRFSAL